MPDIWQTVPDTITIKQNVRKNSTLIKFKMGDLRSSFTLLCAASGKLCYIAEPFIGVKQIKKKHESSEKDAP